MKDVKVLELDKYEEGLIINALNEFRNKLIEEGKDTTFVDELLLKVLNLPEKKECFQESILKKDNYLIYVLGIIPVIWLGVLIAPISSNGLFNIIEGFSNAISHPFNMIFVKILYQ